MKKIIISFALLVGSTVLAAPPSVEMVANSILKDSGIVAAVSSQSKVGVASDGAGADRYMLQFRTPNGPYSCDMSFIKPIELKQGKYLVQAEMDNCADENGEAISLNKEYTDKLGRATFSRVFFQVDSKWKFLPMTDDERILARKSIRDTSDSGSIGIDGIHAINDKLVIIRGQEGAILGN
jgi:hypothetical protein